MDYFHSSIVERLAAEARADAIAHARRDGMARPATPAADARRHWPAPLARLAQLLRPVSAFRTRWDHA